MTAIDEREKKITKTIVSDWVGVASEGSRAALGYFRMPGMQCIRMRRVFLVGLRGPEGASQHNLEPGRQAALALLSPTIAKSK